MKTYLFIITILISCISISFSQEDDSLDIDIAAFVWMDSMVVTASRNDFDVNEFIEMVKKDKSFYQAFKNTRTMTYSSDNDVRMLDKTGSIAATYKSKTIQSSDGKCRTMEFFDEEHTGNYYKKGKKLKYYTAKMYDRLFFTHGKKCEGTATGKAKKKKGMEKYVVELKKLIFQPGEKVNVPFIKNKTEIFSKKMIKYYDFLITSKTYEDGRDCYVFTARLKEKYKDNNKKTVISFLETYFTKEDFQVVARDYTLHYNGAAFDFNIDMRIKLQKIGEKYVPSFLGYKGTWDVPTKKPEWSHFNATFYNYE
jgi:hypothetical protein